MPEHRWRSSSLCSGASSTCVEVTLADEHVLVRDGKNPDGPILRFSPDEWRAFEVGIRAGEFSW